MFKSIFQFISDNLLTILIVAIVIVAAPQLFGVLALFLIVPVISLLLLQIWFRWRMHKFNQRMEDAMNDAQQRRPYNSPHEKRSEGSITIDTSEHPDRRVSDNVGEYIDFKEIKDEDK
ncbi:MAG: DUF4834 family protein [Alistipes sp.]|nr:DUF4834 family protein [Alistipes sp.]